MPTANPTISLIIPTVSRPTLTRTLRSIRLQPWIHGDEVLLVGDGPQPIARELFEQLDIPGRVVEVPRTQKPDWGHTPRNLVMHQATGDYLAALDDDDEWTPNALELIRAALLTGRRPRPHIFRMTGAPNVGDVWKVPEIREGNVGTPMLVFPRSLGWGTYTPRYGGDFDFISETCGRCEAGPVWHEDVICRVRPA